MITDWKTSDDLRRLVECRFSTYDQAADNFLDELEFSTPRERRRAFTRWVDQRMDLMVDDLCKWLEETK